MKKRLITTILATAMVFSTLIGCGKTEEEKAAEEFAEALQNSELGMMAEEKAEEVEETMSAEEKRIAEFRLVEPKDEIVGSKVSDSIIQIEDQIINIDGTMTLKQAIDAIAGAYEFDITATYSDTTKYGKGTEVTEDSLVQAGSSGFSSESFIIQDDLGNEIVSIRAYKGDVTDTKKAYDCPVIDMSVFNDIYALNIFYAGNICEGTYSDTIKKYCPDLYEERIQTHPPIKYDELEAFIEDKCPDEERKLRNHNSDTEEVYFVNKSTLKDIDGKEIYIKKNVSFCTDLSAAEVSTVAFTSELCYGDDYLFKVGKKDDVSDEDFEKIVEENKNAVLDNYYVEGENPEVVGWTTDEGSDSSFTSDKLRLIYRTDKGEYVLVDTNVFVLCNKELEIRNGNSSPNIYSSVEELLEGQYIDINDYVSLEN